jgi:hypothetical protein
MPSGRVDLRSLGLISGRGANWTLTVEGMMGRDAEDWRERSSNNEGVEEPGDDTCPTSRDPWVSGIEVLGRAVLDMW